MSSSKADLLCSPNHDDKFVIFGQELNLYKVGKKKTIGELPRTSFNFIIPCEEIKKH